MTDSNTVSEHDRDYFRRLGEWERENAEEDLRRHIALSISERVRASEQMSERWRKFVHDDHSDDRPEEFYERAKRLGLYKADP